MPGPPAGPIAPLLARSKPPVGSRLDLAHPLARGLQVAVLFAEGAGTRVTNVGRTLPGTPGTFSATGLAWTPGRDGGRAVNVLAGGAGVVSLTGLPDAPFLGELTIVWRGMVRSAGTYRHFAGKHASNGSTVDPFDFRTGSSGLTLHLLRANAANVSAGSDGPALTVGRWQTLAVSARAVIEFPAQFYVDGRGTVGTNNVGDIRTGAPTGSNAALVIGRRADGAVQLDGAIEVVLIYSRILSASEHAWLAVEPYAPFVASVPRRFWLVPPASGGAPATGRSSIVVVA